VSLKEPFGTLPAVGDANGGDALGDCDWLGLVIVDEDGVGSCEVFC
jgi:hypothetical protein